MNDDIEMIVPLPVAGLMSNEDGYKIAEQYSLIDKAVKEAGSTLGFSIYDTFLYGFAGDTAFEAE